MQDGSAQGYGAGGDQIPLPHHPPLVGKGWKGADVPGQQAPARDQLGWDLTGGSTVTQGKLPSSR